MYKIFYAFIAVILMIGCEDDALLITDVEPGKYYFKVTRSGQTDTLAVPDALMDTYFITTDTSTLSSFRIRDTMNNKSVLVFTPTYHYQVDFEDFGNELQGEGFAGLEACEDNYVVVVGDVYMENGEVIAEYSEVKTDDNGSKYKDVKVIFENQLFVNNTVNSAEFISGELFVRLNQ